jgi:hypothetical protein
VSKSQTKAEGRREERKGKTFEPIKTTREVIKSKI